MRPFFTKSLPGILARFYDKARHYDPSSGRFKDGTMQQAIRMQLQHWEMIAAGDFGAEYLNSATRFCELTQRARVSPQWHVGGRQMFIADQLMKAAKNEIAIPRLGPAARQESLDAKRHRQGHDDGHAKHHRGLFRIQPSGPQGRDCRSQQPLPHHHHLAVDDAQQAPPVLNTRLQECCRIYTSGPFSYQLREFPVLRSRQQ
jgi:hypothetical protein